MPRFPQTNASSQSLSAGVFSVLRERLGQMTGPIFPLNVGDTWLEPLMAARAEAQRTDDAPHLHTYAPVQGLPVLLDAITAKVKRRTGITLPRAALQVVSGATSGISVVCQALLDPGDEVILPAPFWPLIRGIINSRGAKAVEVPFFETAAPDGDGAMIEAALEAAITDRTVAIYLNTPHNPTGVILNDAQIAAFARVAQRHDLWVFSDEVYEDLWMGEAHANPRPAWTYDALRDRTVAVHSLSKAYGLAGSRVGYCHGPIAAMTAIRAVQTHQVYCAAKPLQRGAAAALNHGDDWLDAARGHYLKAATMVAETFGVPVPAGGTFIFVDASPWRRDGETMLDLLTRVLEHGVMLTPGDASGTGYDRFIRICFTSVPPDDLADALTRVKTALNF